jgi:asparagine synthase (glutamine-hydrolysing)
MLTAARLPPALKLHRGEGKYVLKSALEPYVPKDVLYRPKRGFSVPLAAWFRGPLRERLTQALSGKLLQDSGFFDTRFVERLLRQHLSGGFDHSPPLWQLLMFDAFMRNSQDPGDSGSLSPVPHPYDIAPKIGFQ